MSILRTARTGGGHALGVPGELTRWVRSRRSRFGSARVAYDMAESVFACHDTRVVEKAAICAGFLLRGAAHSLAIRLAYLRGQIDPGSISDAGLALHKSYRAMAVANGVAGDDPALAPCRAAEG